MATVVLIIHLLIAVALVGVVLMQKSEGGALGIGGGGGGGGGFLTGRGTANLLTRTTAILAVAFFCTSMLLAILAGRTSDGGSVFDRVPASQQEQPNVPTTPGSGGGLLDDLQSGRGLAPLPSVPSGQ
ncbi:MAG: preprotein translocase subunit SecG [Hyphomicrobiaceae bacterium]